MNNSDALDLLADLFASPSTQSQRKAPAKPVKKALPKLAMHKEFNQTKTGYITWNAVKRVVVLQDQECKCCGSSVRVVKDELFVLENKTSHSVWYRHEAYGILESDNLPVEFEVREELQKVSACGECLSEDWDLERALEGSRQMELML